VPLGSSPDEVHAQHIPEMEENARRAARSFFTKATSLHALDNALTKNMDGIVS
jgi:hypothetical protein